MTPPAGPRGLPWSGGAWLGGQVGATLWMLPYAALLAVRDPFLAVLAGASCLALNVLGARLWARRGALGFAAATTRLLVATGLAGAALAVAGRLRGLDPSLRVPPLALALFPALIALVLVRDRVERARQDAGEGG